MAVAYQHQTVSFKPSLLHTLAMNLSREVLLLVNQIFNQVIDAYAQTDAEEKRNFLFEIFFIIKTTLSLKILKESALKIQPRSSFLIYLQLARFFISFSFAAAAAAAAAGRSFLISSFSSSSFLGVVVVVVARQQRTTTSITRQRERGEKLQQRTNFYFCFFLSSRECSHILNCKKNMLTGSPLIVCCVAGPRIFCIWQEEDYLLLFFILSVQCLDL